MAQPADNTLAPPPATHSNPRFTLELEFVLSLANPHYLSHLAITYPNLLGTTSASSTTANNTDADDAELSSSPASSEAQAFTAYLAYLYSYWKTPEYAQFLTHPGATLRALRLLQEESFRRDVIRPQVIEGLLGVGVGAQNTEGKGENEDPNANANGGVDVGGEKVDG
ncbi:suppressor of hpr1 [Arachnomyces sp. PD_36]|nr:suppressor of hpr1 [Arachnomyces sp. PD_36]